MPESYRAAWRQDIKDHGTQAWKDARMSIHRIVNNDKVLRVYREFGLLEIQRESTLARRVIRQHIDDMRARAFSITPSIPEERLDEYVHLHPFTTDVVPAKPSVQHPIRSVLRGRIHPTSHLHS